MFTLETNIIFVGLLAPKQESRGVVRKRHCPKNESDDDEEIMGDSESSSEEERDPRIKKSFKKSKN